MEPKQSVFISVRPEETRLGLCEEGRLREYAVERRNGENLVGNVYRGRVCNVVPGIQAAFVDLGIGKNGFLTLKKEEQVTEGQMLLVQVTKDARGNKGPAITRHITLPGRYVVLEPNGKRISLSRKIACKTKRNALHAFAESLLPPHMGLVIRTAALRAEGEEIKADLSQLLRNWDVLLRRSKVGRGPQLLYRELDLSIRMLRDYATSSIEEIVVDEPETLQTVEKLLEEMGLKQVPVALYTGEEDIFSHYHWKKPLPGFLIVWYGFPAAGIWSLIIQRR